jgi:hypothetical protein
MRVVPLLVLSVAAASTAHAGYRVSTFRQETRLGAGTYGAAAALDSDPATAWVTPPEADVVGSWIEIDVPAGGVDKIAMIVGWDKDPNTFGDYARVHTLKVEVFDEGGADRTRPKLQHTVAFEDRGGWQVVDLPDTAVGNELFGGRVRLTVVEAFPGKDYPNLGVSEVLLHLTEMAAPAVMREPPASHGEGHDVPLLTDGDARTFWTAGPAGAGSEFTVGASGFGLSSVGITVGPRTHARPRTVEIVANDQTRRHELPEVSRDAVWLPVPPMSGYTGSGYGDVTVRIVDTWPGTGATAAELAIAEVALKATSAGGL